MFVSTNLIFVCSIKTGKTQVKTKANAKNVRLVKKLKNCFIFLQSHLKNFFISLYFLFTLTLRFFGSCIGVSCVSVVIGSSIGSLVSLLKSAIKGSIKFLPF